MLYRIKHLHLPFSNIVSFDNQKNKNKNSEVKLESWIVYSNALFQSLNEKLFSKDIITIFTNLIIKKES